MTRITSTGRVFEDVEMASGPLAMVVLGSTLMTERTLTLPAVVDQRIDAATIEAERGRRHPSRRGKAEKTGEQVNILYLGH